MVDIDETQLDSPPSRWLWPSGSGWYREPRIWVGPNNDEEQADW